MRHLIYVRVLHFPGGLLQPVQAELVHGNCYRVVDSSDDPEHDVWEFGAGDVVHCGSTVFAEGEVGLVADGACTCAVDPA